MVDQEVGGIGEWRDWSQERAKGREGERRVGEEVSGRELVMRMEVPMRALWAISMSRSASPMRVEEEGLME